MQEIHWYYLRRYIKCGEDRFPCLFRDTPVNVGGTRKEHMSSAGGETVALRQGAEVVEGNPHALGSLHSHAEVDQMAGMVLLLIVIAGQL